MEENDLNNAWVEHFWNNGDDDNMHFICSSFHMSKT